MFGAGSPWPVEARPAFAAVWASNARSRQTPASSRASRCLGTPSASKPDREPGRVAPVVVDRDQRRGDALAGLPERALLLDGEGREAEVREHVDEVDDRVGVEHDRVVARVDRHGLPGGGRAPGRLATDRGGVDRGRVDRDLLGVARPVVGTHRHREQLRRGPPLGGADPPRVGDRDGLGVRGERAERRHAGRVGGGDHRAGALGAQLGARGGGRIGPGRGQRARRGRLREAGPVVALLDVGRDRRGPLDERTHAVGVDAPGARDPHPPALDEAQVDEHLVARDVLVDLAVREPGQRRGARDDQRLGLARAHRLGLPDDLLRDAERRLRVVADAAIAAGGAQDAHATTPTRTLRNRAPDAPWPTWPAWPGSPLPQFGVLHISHDEASPTASIERHSSYVMPV